MLNIDPSKEKLGTVHSFILGAVGPRPIALASTIDQDGNPNLSPFSFFNAFSVNPPILVFSPSRRGTDGSTKHTLENMMVTKEVVINIETYNMVQQASLASTEYPKGVNEFVKAGFTPLKSEIVKPFRIKESPVHFECKVNEIIELAKKNGSGNLIISEILLMHINEEILDPKGKIDPFKIDLVGRMGGNWYCRANFDALFEVEKPLATLGIGVDKIPHHIAQSKVLTGNDLGQLGNVEFLPSPSEIELFKKDERFLRLIKDVPHSVDNESNHLHLIAKIYLDEGKVNDAWKTLLYQE